MIKTARTSLAPVVGMPLSTSAKGSFNGLILFIIGFSLVGSGFSVMRFSFLGLRVHTYLIVIGVLFPLLATTRLHLIPSRILLELTAFASLYYATTIPAGGSTSEGIKIFAAVTTIVTMAMLVRSWDDFVAGVLGMTLAVGILAVKGLEADMPSGQGIRAMEEANRNTYSLYALPSILLGCYVLVRGRPDSLIRKALLAVSVFASSLSICLNLNRSGWLGLAVIAVLIIREKSFKAAVIFVLLGGGIFVLIATMFSPITEDLQMRLHGTQTSKGSDQLRINLIKNSFRIALENPLMGISPQELPYELGKNLGYSSGGIVAHNVYAHLAGGCGFVVLALFFHLGHLLWTWSPAVPLSQHGRLFFKESQKIMRLILTLWLVRGFFTHEIIYSPAFCMAIGLALGMELSNVPKSTISTDPTATQKY